VCDLGYYYGRTRFILMEPVGSAPTSAFEPHPPARCQALAAP
jgi:hypothetical protein